MHTGKGYLILPDGRKLALNYQFGSNFDGVCSGVLHLNTTAIDPASYGERMDLLCDDGTAVRFIVTHFGDRYLAVSGSVEAEAA